VERIGFQRGILVADKEHLDRGVREAMRVLIVGAAGSLGRQLAPELTGHGHEVVCFDLKPLEGTPYRWIAGDARVPQELAEAARECEAAAHLPAWHGIHLRHRSRRDFWELNVDGTSTPTLS
jgi:uronate dehydrogenase